LKYTARLWQVAILVAGIAGATNLSIADEVSDEAAQHVLAAEEALKSQDYQLAAREYRLAAEASENADIARQATQVAYSYGLNDDALLAARRWAELAPESDEALIYLAQLYLRTGEIRESRKYFERLLEKGDDPVDERLLALVPVLSREDATNAYELMRQLARPYKDSAKAHYAVAVLALEAGDTETAGERAQAAIELEPDWLQPRLLYSRSLLLAGDDEGAIDYAAMRKYADWLCKQHAPILLLTYGSSEYLLLWWTQIALFDVAVTCYCIALDEEEMDLVPYALGLRFYAIFTDVAKLLAITEELLNVARTIAEEIASNTSAMTCSDSYACFIDKSH